MASLPTWRLVKPSKSDRRRLRDLESRSRLFAPTLRMTLRIMRVMMMGKEDKDVEEDVEAAVAQKLQMKAYLR